MRITNAQLQDQIISFLAGNQERLASVQRQISTSKEVATSSDDPVKFNRAGRFKSLLKRTEQHLDNIGSGLAWIRVGAESLNIVYDALQQIRQLGMQSRSDADPGARATTAVYVEAAIKEMVQMGNTRFAGRFIFGGTITKGADPFTFDGISVTYAGNDGEISRKVGEGTYLRINIVGSEFDNIFAAAIAMRDAMVANDGLAMDAALAAIDTVSEELLTTITGSGSIQRRLELTRDNLEISRINLQATISQAEDVDLTEAIMRFNARELGFRAALESSTRIMSISILNHLR